MDATHSPGDCRCDKCRGLGGSPIGRTPVQELATFRARAGSLLRGIRKRRAQTREAVAEATGLSVWAVKQVEIGKGSFPAVVRYALHYGFELAIVPKY